jgi:hypothetical protein
MLRGAGSTNRETFVGLCSAPAVIGQQRTRTHRRASQSRETGGARRISHSINAMFYTSPERYLASAASGKSLDARAHAGTAELLSFHETLRLCKRMP